MIHGCVAKYLSELRGDILPGPGHPATGFHIRSAGDFHRWTFLMDPKANHVTHAKIHCIFAGANGTDLTFNRGRVRVSLGACCVQPPDAEGTLGGEHVESADSISPAVGQTCDS